MQRHDSAFLTKDFDWTWDVTPNDIFYTPHRDIALDQLVELNSKQIDLRANVIKCEADANGELAMQLQADNARHIKKIKSQPSAAKKGEITF